MRGLSALVLSTATFWVATSADAQIVIDGHFADWDGINAATVDDAKDMADSSGDIRQIQAHVEGGNLHLSMSVHGIAAPSVDDTPEGMKNRYYYHWLFDTDNDTATGFKNDAYEGNPTGLAKPIGVDLVVMSSVGATASPTASPPTIPLSVMTLLSSWTTPLASAATRSTP